MFPIQVPTSTNKLPYVTTLFLLVTIALFIATLVGQDFDWFLHKYGFIAVYFNRGNILSYMYMVMSLFLHGGFMHLLIDIWFLSIIGPKIEETIGHSLYILLFLLSGVVSIFTSFSVRMDYNIPLIGMSSSISALVAAYLVFFNKDRVRMLVVGGKGLLSTVWMPAAALALCWAILLLINPVGSLGTVRYQIGYMPLLANAAGFVFGGAFAWILKVLKVDEAVARLSTAKSRATQEIANTV